MRNIPKRIVTSEFESTFNGSVIIDKDIEKKINNKHKVYREDLYDALGDPYLVVMRTRRKSPLPEEDFKSKGQVYEILCVTETGKVLFIIGRLFEDGNLYLITSYWANRELETIYREESEVLRDE